MLVLESEEQSPILVLIHVDFIGLFDLVRCYICTIPVLLVAVWDGPAFSF
jgi:hypothetical protein